MKIIVVIPFMFDAYLETDFLKNIINEHEHVTFIYPGECNQKYRDSQKVRFVANNQFYPDKRNLLQKIGWRCKVWFIGNIRKVSFIARKDLNSTYKEKSKRINSIVLRFLSRIIGCSVFSKERRLRALVNLLTSKNSRMGRYLNKEGFDYAYVVTAIHDNISVDWLRVIKGFPVCQIIHSWDNLTSKGMFIVPPERMFVWGKYDRHVAISQHNISKEIIEVIGPIIISSYAKNQKQKRRSEKYILFAGVTPALVSDEWPYVVHLSKMLSKLGHYIKLIYRPHPRVLRAIAPSLTGVDSYISNNYKIVKHSENIFLDVHYQGHASSMKFLQSECCCVVTYYSTVSLEFVLSGKPAINFSYEISNEVKINKSIPKYAHINELNKELLFVEVTDNTALEAAVTRFTGRDFVQKPPLASSLNIATMK